MKTLYKIHKISGLISAVIFIILCITGFVLLFRGEIAEINSVSDENIIVTEQVEMPVWEYADEGVKEIRDKYPDSIVESIRAYPEDNSLGIRFSSNGKNHRSYYDVSGKCLISSSEKPKSKFVADAMRTIHRLHMNLTMGGLGRNLLYFFCVMSLVTIVTGYVVNTSFSKVSPVGYIRQINYRRKISDWHRFISAMAGPWALILTLSALLILVYSDITREYTTQAYESGTVVEGASGFKTVSITDVVKKLRQEYPDKKLVSLSMPSEDEGFYAAQLADYRENKSLYTAYEYAFVSPNNVDDMVYVPGENFRKYLAEALNVHIHNHPLLILKVLWAIMALLSVAMAITGLWVYCTRWQKGKNAVIVPVNTSAMPQYRILMIIAVLSLLGIVLPIISEKLNYFAAGSLAVVFIFAAYVYCILNISSKTS